MAPLAVLLLVFAALVAGFHAAADRWPRGAAPTATRVRWMQAGLAAGLSAGFGIAVAAMGWAVGIAVWLVAIMVAGVAVVAVASVYPLLARRLAGLSGATGLLVVILAGWGA